MKLILTFILLAFASSSFSQKKSIIFPIWTYHQRNASIYGISVGFGTLWESREEPRNTNTTGIKLELIGTGILLPLKPDNIYVVDNDSALKSLQIRPLSERINGISLTGTGTVCNCIVNGVSLALIGKMEYKVNGISAAMVMNSAQLYNGVQLGFANSSYKMKGLQIGGYNLASSCMGVQIGLLNESKKTRGIQIGLWNINERRKLPIINWNFGN